MILFERRETMNTKKQNKHVDSQKQIAQKHLQSIRDYDSHIIRLRIALQFVQRFYDERENIDNDNIACKLNMLIENVLIQRMKIEHILFNLHANRNFRCVLNDDDTTMTTTRRIVQQFKRRRQNA